MQIFMTIQKIRMLNSLVHKQFNGIEQFISSNYLFLFLVHNFQNVLYLQTCRFFLQNNSQIAPFVLKRLPMIYRRLTEYLTFTYFPLID